MEKAQNSIAALTSRRNFIASSAALAVASAAPALALASEGQDAELIELGRQLEIITIQRQKASDASSRLYDVAIDQYPALPEVLKARETDKRFDLPKPNDGKWYKPSKGGNRSEPGYYATGHLNELKQFRPYQRKDVPVKEYRPEMFGTYTPIAVIDVDSDVVFGMVPWPEAQARVDELIAAIEVWDKACRKINHASGYMRAEREFERMDREETAMLERIVGIDAKSLQGLLVKARAVKLLHSDEDRIEFGECTDEVLAASILNDLLALQA